MQVNTQKVDIEQSPDIEQSQFQIAMTAQAMDLLSNKIYSDPIMAVCREYICNAFDAHNMVNSSAAIDIQCPNALEPTWSVRDYGPGMSPSQIMGDKPNGFQGLFNTYFLSNKSSNNKAIGGFGLGCKAGFAYVKRDGAFTVTSWHEGKKTVYACHRNATGFPSVSLMSQSDTDEPSGIKINIPIHASDIGSFVDRTVRTLTYADMPYNIEGTERRPEKPTIIMDRGFWKLVSGGSNTIVMGGVGYPIDHHHFTGVAHKLLRLGGIIITAPIGSVELSVSREDLSYEGSTLTFINDAVNAIAQELKQEFFAKVQAEDSLYNASLTFHKLLQHNITSAVVDRAPTWNGKRLLYTIPDSAGYSYNSARLGVNSSTSIFAPESLRKVKEKRLDATTNTLVDHVVDKGHVFYRITTQDVLSDYFFKLKLAPKSWKHSLSVSLYDNYLMVHVEDDKDLYKKLYTLRESGELANYKFLLLVRNVTKLGFMKMYTRIGRHNAYKFAADIVPTKLPKTGTKAIPNTTLVRDVNLFRYRYSGYSNNSNRTHFKYTQVDFGATDQTYYYIPVYNYEFQIDFKGTATLSADGIRQFKETYLPANKEVYLVPRTFEKLVKANANWVNLWQYAREQIDAEFNKAGFKEMYATKLELNDKSALGAPPDWLEAYYNNTPKVKNTFLKDIYKTALKIKSLPKWSNNPGYNRVTDIGRAMNVPLPDVSGVTPMITHEEANVMGKLVSKIPIVAYLPPCPPKEVLDNLTTLVLNCK